MEFTGSYRECLVSLTGEPKQAGLAFEAFTTTCNSLPLQWADREGPVHSPERGTTAGLDVTMLCPAWMGAQDSFYFQLGPPHWQWNLGELQVSHSARPRVPRWFLSEV